VIGRIWHLAATFCRRDLAVDAAYKAALALEGLDVILGAAAFYYFAQVVGDRRPDGYDAFGFLLIGVAVNNAMTTTLTCFTRSVRNDQQNGVVKPLAASPMAPAAILALSAVYPIVRALVGAGACLVAGALLGLSYDTANPGAAVVVGFAATAAFAAIGTLSAVFTLLLKRGDPVLWLFGTMSWLLGGVFFPVSVLPPELQQVSNLLPMTHALDAVRATLLEGASLQDVQGHLAVLTVIAAAGLPLGLAGIGAATARNRRTGRLGHA
jgi:ABC-2 type transport system permease protein